MKFLIIGLGNFGQEYELTRHNIGFLILDFLAKKFKKNFLRDKYVKKSFIQIKGRKIYLIKPTTYMNLSGKAVKYWVEKLKIKKENILVVLDDISLPYGKNRIRKKGSDGGHNGLKSINDSLSSNEYPRLRFGIGNEYKTGKKSHYVLENFSEAELKKIEEKIGESIKIIESFCFEGIEICMNKYN